MRQANSHATRLSPPHSLWARCRLVRARARRLGRATLGMLGLWIAACGTDQPQEPAAPRMALTLGQDTVRLGLTVPTRPPVTHVVIVGDSISEGLGAESTAMSYAALLYRNNDQLYPQERGRDLVSHFGPHLTYLNLAHAGDTSDEVVTNQLPKLTAQLSQRSFVGESGTDRLGDDWQVHGRVLVMMTVGGNDVQLGIRRNPNFTGPVLTHSMINLRSILDYFEDRTHFPDGVSLYFGNIYDVTDGEDQCHSCMPGMAFPGMSQALDVWSDAYAQLAQQRHATLVDLLSLFRGHGFNFSNPDNPYFDPRDTTLWVYDRDCIHPNNRGHHKLRRAFYNHVARDYPRQR